MTDKFSYNTPQTAEKLYQEFNKTKEKINSLCYGAKGLIKICAKDLCDVTALLPEMAEALPTESQRKKARELIKHTFR